MIVSQIQMSPVNESVTRSVKEVLLSLRFEISKTGKDEVAGLKIDHLKPHCELDKNMLKVAA